MPEALAAGLLDIEGDCRWSFLPKFTPLLRDAAAVQKEAEQAGISREIGSLSLSSIQTEGASLLSWPTEDDDSPELSSAAALRQEGRDEDQKACGRGELLAHDVETIRTHFQQLREPLHARIASTELSPPSFNLPVIRRSNAMRAGEEWAFADLQRLRHMRQHHRPKTCARVNVESTSAETSARMATCIDAALLWMPFATLLVESPFSSES
eukprot:4502017-Amphidinium_carterae.2